VLLILLYLRFPNCSTLQMQPVPQDHPSRKRQQTANGCFSICFHWWHCPCSSLPVTAWFMDWKDTKVSSGLPLLYVPHIWVLLTETKSWSNQPKVGSCCFLSQSCMTNHEPWLPGGLWLHFHEKDKWLDFGFFQAQRGTLATTLCSSPVLWLAGHIAGTFSFYLHQT
jgi:hypothetical protein